MFGKLFGLGSSGKEGNASRGSSPNTGAGASEETRQKSGKKAAKQRMNQKLEDAFKADFEDEEEVKATVEQSSDPVNTNVTNARQKNQNGDKKRPAVTSTNSLQRMSMSNSAISTNIDQHYEANYKEKTLIEINRNRLNRKIQNMEQQITCPLIKLDKLRTLSWSGIPSCVPEIRGTVWSLLSDYIPIDQEIKEDTLTRKREEYIGIIRHYFGDTTMEQSVDDLAACIEDMSNYETHNFKQIKIDVYRTQPEVELFSSQPIQTMLIRILFAWTMRHPASAYVQGINDLAAPMVLVYLTAAVAIKKQRDAQLQLQQEPEESKELIVAAQKVVTNHNSKYRDLILEDITSLNIEDFLAVEADSFWCLTKLVDDIQDNYTDLQPGVHKMINKMKAVIEQVDADALVHLESMDLQFMDFAYRWVACYLTREFNIFQIIRIWDTYLSEDEGFSQFHCYVCAALFLHFSPRLKQMEYQDAIMFLQNLPTKDWTENDLDMLLSKSFELKSLYHYNTHLINTNQLQQQQQQSQ